MPSIVFMSASSNDEPIELDLTKATKKDVYNAFKKVANRPKIQKLKGNNFPFFSCKNFSLIL